MYWIVYGVGMIMTLFFSIIRRSHFDITKKQCVTIFLLMIPFTYLGGKLLYIIENPHQPLTFGGMSFFGTVLFIPVFWLAACKIAKWDYASIMDLYMPYEAFMLGVMRIGCTIDDCCGAAEIYINGRYYIPPIQAIESVCDFLFFIFLMYREYKGKILVKGEQGCYFIIFYGFLRMITEHYRNTPKSIYGMSNGQWLAIITALIAFIILMIMYSGLAIRINKEKK